ncbi:hypothetical protein ACIGZH_23240 [Streptomyces sp. NPDC058319]|uniref:hypothetical protein n=1 Tax=unclassified Streptomyces TaxID=2593676 RepID=UPI0007F9DBE7|nr:hypothetical protein [Streptomyces sp. SAT1]ANO42367.1 hypothetical protein A8713_034490 [Streptomyces sp. SAT1]
MSGLRYGERVDLALAADDPEAVLDVAVAACEACRGFPGMVWQEVVEQLAGQPAGTRTRLVAAIPARLAPAGRGLREGLLYLSVALSRGLPGETLVAERREALGRTADRWQAIGNSLAFAEAELDAGRPLPPAVVAAVRRGAADRYSGPKDLAGRMTEPVLNVGEQWAETAMADILALRPVWRDLLAHATTARAVRPTATWERKGRALLDDVGPEAFRTRAPDWLALAGRPRTLTLRQDFRDAPVNELLDPFNADALRGLTWLLALTGPDERTATALGALADTALRRVPHHGPCHPRVAGSAVYALDRLGGPDARAELRRLAERTTYRTTLRQIEAALARAESQPQ